jgi:alpha-L-arabinofuranosidase
MKKGLFLFFLLLLTSLSLSLAIVSAQDDPLVVDPLIVDASEVIGEVSPYVLGANYGAYGTLPPDQFENATNSGVHFIRFPGGAAFDEDGRDVSRFDVDMFMIICNMIGCEPSIQMRLYGGTPEQAAEMVEYVNIEKEYGVDYWSIGNEPNLYPEDYTVEDLNTEWRAIAEAMLDVDPDIRLIGPDLSQYADNISATPKDANGKDWMEEFLKANGDVVDIVSVHRYPFPQNNEITTIDDLRANSREWDTIIPFLRERVTTITGKDKPLAITEINSHWANILGGEATSDSYFHAIWMADVLGRMIKNQASIVAYFDFYGAPDRAFGLIDRYAVRPTYYTYQLYSQFGSQLLEASSEDPNVSLYAALTEAGDLTLMVVNLGDDEVTKPLELTGFTAGGDAEVWRFDIEHNAEMIGEETFGDSITVPGQSITLYIVPS